jgi:hypothetical protein
MENFFDALIAHRSKVVGEQKVSTWNLQIALRSFETQK